MGSKKKTSKKKSVSKSELIMVPIRIHPREIKQIKANAKKYAFGNSSAWMRYASLRYRPKRGEVIPSVTMPSVKKKR